MGGIRRDGLWEWRVQRGWCFEEREKIWEEKRVHEENEDDACVCACVGVSARARMCTCVLV